MGHLSGFGYGYVQRFRFRTLEWRIFQDSDMAMGNLSGFGHGNGASFRNWIKGIEHLSGFGYGNGASF